MKRFLRTIIVMSITFLVIIVLFWFILPMTGFAETVGSAYFLVALVGSLIVSYMVSWGLNKLLSLKKKNR